MSINTSGELHSELNLGDAIPGEESSSESTHLFVSLSDLVSENIFYHPCYKNVEYTMSYVELTYLDAILGEVSIEEHFVATLTERIMQSVKTNHQSVRVALGNADSYELSSLLGGKAEAQ